MNEQRHRRGRVLPFERPTMSIRIRTSEPGKPMEEATITMDVNAAAAASLFKKMAAERATMGAAAPAPASMPVSEGGASMQDYLRTLAPVAKDLLSTSAEADVEVLKAKIKNHKRLRDTMPEPFKTFYANQVRVLQAKLRAAESAKTEEKKTTQSRWEWAALGKTSVVVGIFVGAALTALLLKSAIRRH